MGGEGVPWIGQAPFTGTPHVFQNLGDGTYNHSGISPSAPRWRRRSTSPTRSWYNDAVAMTGGQPHDGTLSVPIIAARSRPRAWHDHGGQRRHAARPARRSARTAWRSATATNSTPCSASCAPRRPSPRSSTTRPAPPRSAAAASAASSPTRQARGHQRPGVRGCGDCSDKSNCMSVGAVETEFGRKRTIDQSSQQGLFLREGLLPELRHRRRRQGAAARRAARAPSAPSCGRAPRAATAPDTGRALGHPDHRRRRHRRGDHRRVAGMAAHLEGKGSVLDMAGLAQKGGAVWSHVRIADCQSDSTSPRASPPARPIAVIGCDPWWRPARIARQDASWLTRVINSDQTNQRVRARPPPRPGSGNVGANPDFAVPGRRRWSTDRRRGRCGQGRVSRRHGARHRAARRSDRHQPVHARLRLAARPGAAFAAGDRSARSRSTAPRSRPTRPPSCQGRAAVDLRGVREAAKPQASARPRTTALSTSVDELIARRRPITDYQGCRLRQALPALVERVRAAEAKVAPARPC